MKTFLTLGKKIKKYRLLKNESLSRIAEAIGVDHSYLSKIENGLRKPSFQILQKLIQHFSLTGLEVMEMMYLSGYSSPVALSHKHSADFSHERNLGNTQEREEVSKMQDTIKTPITKDLQVNVPPGTPVLYTDSCFVTDSPFGIVMDYAQRLGPTNRQTVVARVGMSVEHAEALVKVLSQKIIDSKLKAKKEGINNN